MKHFSVLIALLCLLSWAVLGWSSFSSGRKVSDIPNPNKDPLSCGRLNVAKSAVCDPDNKLTKDIKDEIEGYLNQITNAQVAVAVIDKMGIGSSDVDAAAEKFARTLHDNWGVGSAEKNDGILIFLSIKDRAVYISTGVGVQSKVTSRYIQDIINDMKPNLRKSDYGAAISTSIIEIDMYVNGDAGQIHSNLKQRIINQRASGGTVKDTADSSSFVIVLVVCMIFVGIGQWKAYQRNKTIRGYERGKAALDSLMKDVDNTEENNKFFTTSCPICLEDFPITPSTPTTTTEEVKDEPSLTASGATSDPYHPDDKDSDSENQLNTVDLTLVGGSGVENRRAKNTFSKIAEPAKPASMIPGMFGSNATAAAATGKKPKALRCGHTFCAECLESFLKTSDGNKCPICRMPVEEGGADQPPLPQQQPRGTLFGQPPNNGSAGGDSGTGGGGGGGGASEPPRRSCAESFRTDDLPTHTDSFTSGSGGMHQRYSSYSSSSSSYYSNTFARRTPELLFRMNRMRYLYPDYMTVEMLRSMNTAIERGNIHEFRNQITSRGTEVVRIVSDIRARAAAEARSSGRSGSSFSFGGGRSGGGGGGRW